MLEKAGIEASFNAFRKMFVHRLVIGNRDPELLEIVAAPGGCANFRGQPELPATKTRSIGPRER